MADEVEQRFLDAIAANPEDRAARDVYADWLEERGDPRGEYVRLEAQLHSIPGRLAELLGAIDPAWLAKLARTYDVVLVEGGANKIGVIKLVREITGLGLKEAKDLVVDEIPRAVATHDLAAANRLARRFEETGALVHVLPHGARVDAAPASHAGNVVLASIVAGRKIEAIKCVREVTGMSLVDAKALVERVEAGSPMPVIARVTPERAAEIVALFRACGQITIIAAR